MSLKLDDRAIAAAIDFMAKKLPSLRVINGNWLDRGSVFELVGVDKILSGNKVFDADMESYIGEYPVWTYIVETIARDVESRNDFEMDVNLPLIVLPMAHDTIEYLRSLITRITTLPFSYTFTFELPPALQSLLSSNMEEYQLSSTVRLKRVDAQFSADYPLKADTAARTKRLFGSGIASMLLDADKWREGSVVLQIDATGFVGEYATTATLQHARSILKSFFGLMIAARAVGIEHDYSWISPKLDMVVYYKGVDSYLAYRKVSFEHADAKTISQFTVDESDHPDPESRAYFKLKAIEPAFGSYAECQRVLHAARWLYESVASEKELLSFVQAMVCLEILVGENSNRDELSVAATIRNRCAFMIARNHVEREAILSILKEIYRVRSNILHHGHDELSSAELRMLYRLRDICGMVILHELKLLGAPRRGEPPKVD